MAGFAQLIGWLSVIAGMAALAYGFSESGERVLALFAPGLILGGLTIGLLGEIAAHVGHIRQIADAAVAKGEPRP
jgi:hypothetical protein